MASKAHEQTEALAAAERRARALAAEHNTAIASMQSRFADFAAKLEEKRRAQQSHLESVLRREIAQYDEVKGQIGSATEAATAERTRLMTELNVVLAAHEAGMRTWIVPNRVTAGLDFSLAEKVVGNFEKLREELLGS
jgi:beta-phosphoglucomutase-like phosphatase (HAD superfamily)